MENLKKRDNESKEEFIARVYDSKVKNNLKNEDCAKIINKEFGTNWRESYCRGIAKNFKKGYESALKDIKSSNENSNEELNKILKQIEEKQEELEKEKVKIRTLNMERNKINRTNGRVELFYENIKGCIEKIPLPNFELTNISKSKESEYLLAWADIHYNADFDTTNNSYSREECKRRLEYLTSNVINFCKEKNISKLNVIGLGDDIQGLLRVSDIKLNDTSVVESIVEISRLIANMLNEISSVCKVEYYHTMYSNHTQTRNLGTKKGELSREDVELLIGNYIKDLLSDNNRITVNLSSEEYHSFELAGQNIIALHGHQVKSIKNIIKDYSQLHRKFYDIALLGHLHGGQSISVGEIDGNTEIKIVPSIVGSDPYSESLQLTSKAMSKIYKIERNKGIVEEYTFVLN